MKLLIAGNWQWPQYEQAFANSLERLGHDICRFSFDKYFVGRIGHYQRVFPVPGPALWRLNRGLIDFVTDTRPDAVLIWRGTHVLPRTLTRIRNMGVKIISYNNDDPFGVCRQEGAPKHHYFLWLWYLRGLREFDLNFVYRAVNVHEALAFGAKNAHVLMPYFIPEKDRPISLTEADEARFRCDLVYVGHYEPDGREHLLHSLVDAGFHVRLFGGSYWTKRVLGRYASYFGEVRQLHGDDYPKALCAATIALAFLSKLNRDTYTRRCFEIPACGRVLLCERTTDLMRMFKENTEAVFFSGAEELVQKARWLLDHPEQVERIAEAGRSRVWVDGHDVDSRARAFMAIVLGETPKQP
jgi:spore maturation protein CgeB